MDYSSLISGNIDSIYKVLGIHPSMNHTLYVIILIVCALVIIEGFINTVTMLPCEYTRIAVLYTCLIVLACTCVVFTNNTVYRATTTGTAVILQILYKT